MRIAPGQNPDEAMALLVAHLESAVPWRAQVTITPGTKGSPFEVDTTGPATRVFAEALAQAYGGDVVEVGVGGSIPIVSALQDAHPETSMVLNGVADPTSRTHGPNESLSLHDLRNGILGEAIAMRLLAESGISNK